MKGKILLLVLVLLLPEVFLGQTAKPAEPEKTNEFSRYELFGGVDYSAANMVKGSSALVGGSGGVDLKVKKWFGGAIDFGEYSGSTGVAKPTLTTFLAGPEFSIPSQSLTGFFHVLFGVEHVSGIKGIKPDVAFAYAIGGGFDQAVSKHWSVRVSGDAVLASFVLDPDNLGYSPHKHSSARATAAIGYRF